jgi:hypothetical protein
LFLAFRVIILITPLIAFLPYKAEPGPRIISILSISSMLKE